MEKNKTKAFYDNFTKKLLTDYIDGNPRMEKAIKFVLSHISLESKNILDIGCGIGWSTHEIANAFPNAKIKGVDLSSNSIDCANSLFKKDNNEFNCIDVTKETIEVNSVDVIYMIDVLEHIPENERDTFISNIGNLLNDEGKFIVTCPTIFHQNSLREKGEGLQPVDEDITLNVLIDIAKILNGEVTYFEYKSIWRGNDYFHSVITKNVNLGTPKHTLSACLDIEPKPQRTERIINSKYSNLFLEGELNVHKEQEYRDATGLDALKNFLRKIKNRL